MRFYSVIRFTLVTVFLSPAFLWAEEARQLPIPYIHVPAIIDVPSSVTSINPITPGPTDVLTPGERTSIRPSPYVPNVFLEVVVRKWEVPPPYRQPTLQGYGPTFSYSVPVDPRNLPPFWRRTLSGPYNSGYFLPGPNSSGPRTTTTPNTVTRQTLTAFDMSRNYITVPDIDGRPHLIRFEEGTRAELMERIRINSTLGDSVRTFPRVAAHFAVASIVVEMLACFGGNGFNDMAYNAAPASPLCVERLLQSLTSMEGHLGFFAFHILNGFTHKQLHNLFAATSLYINKPLTPQAITAMSTPLRMGALGLSFSAISLVSHVMRNPAMGECLKDIKSGNFSSSFCQTVASDLASADRFWNDFSVSFATIMTSALATGATMSALKDAWTLTTDQQLRRGVVQLTRTARFSGAVREIRRIRILKDIVSVSGGPPGWVALVVTTAGEFVVFLAWHHLLEKPVTETIWSWIDAPDIRRDTDRLLGATQAVRNNQGFSQDTIHTECSTQYQAVNGSKARQRVETCTSTEILADSLLSLRTHAQRFRQKVLLHDMNKSFPQYLTKWDEFLSNYFTGKFVLQDVYQQRSQNASIQLHALQLSTVIYNAWKEYFDFQSFAGLSDSSYEADWLQVRDLIPQLQRDYLNVDAAYRNYSVDPTTDYSKAENTLRDQLLNLKRLTSQGFFAGYDLLQGCDIGHTGYYFLCRALQAMRMVPDQASGFNWQTVNGNLTRNLVLPTLSSAGLVNLPLKDTYLQYICSEKRQFEISNSTQGFVGRLLGREGLPQTLLLPQLITGFENDEWLKQSCASNQYIEDYGQHKLFPEIVDISPNLRVDQEDSFDEYQFGLKAGGLWTTQNSSYIDPMSFLTDSSVPLTSGVTPHDAQLWWNKNAVPQVLTYYTDFIVSFKQMLDENFLNLFNTEEPALQMITTHVVGGTDNELLDVDQVLDSKITNRRRLDLSLLGQMQTLIRALQLMAPSLLDSNENQHFQTMADSFIRSYAEHLRHFKYNADPETLRTDWENRIRGFLQGAQNMDPRCFSYDVAKALFAESLANKDQRHSQLMTSVEMLRAAFSGTVDLPFQYSEIDELSVEDVKKLSNSNYKNYISMQILQEAYELLTETGIYYDAYIHNLGLYNLSPVVTNCENSAAD